MTAGSTDCVTDGGTDNTATQLLDAGTGTATSTSMYLVNAATYNASNGATGGADLPMSYSSPDLCNINDCVRRHCSNDI